MRCFRTDTSKPFVVVAGYITNPRASQVFFIAADELIEFYNLDPEQCCIVPLEFRNNYKAHPAQMVIKPRFKQKYNNVIDRAKAVHHLLDYAI